MVTSQNSEQLVKKSFAEKKVGCKERLTMTLPEVVGMEVGQYPEDEVRPPF